MTALDIFTYSGQQVRTVIVDGEPWFVAADVAGVLEYVNRSAAIAAHCKGVANHYPLQTPGGVQQVRLISEADTLRLILNSKLPSAERFERWVFETVLPSIRKTGSFSAAPALTEDQIVHQALTILVAKTSMLEAQVAELEPAAAAWEELASADGDYSVSDAAKILARAGVETGPQRLFEQMRGLNWLHRGAQKRWTPYQTVVDAGYLAEKPMSHFHPKTGDVVLDPPQVRVTIRGIERLRIRLGSLILAPTG